MKDFAAKYAALAHAVQSGVAAEQQLDQNDIATGKRSYTAVPDSPKMLRTGINMAMVEQGAVVKLLIAKGVITEDEYHEALIEGLEAEVRRYEERLTERFGAPVGLS